MNKKKIILALVGVVVCVSGYLGYATVRENGYKIGANGFVQEDISIDEIKDSLPDIKLEENIVELKTASFTFSKEDYMDELEFGTPWKENSNKDSYIAIEGRGPEALEEGFGFICLKNNNKAQALFLSDDSLGISPKYVEWYDDETFLVYMVNSYGRVFTGGTLYMVNINDMIPKVLYVAGENEEISEANQIDADIINMKILEYKDGSKVSVDKNIKLK